MNIQFIKNKSKNIKTRREMLNQKQNLKNVTFFFLCFIFVVGLIIGVFYFKNVLDSNFFETNPNILESLDLAKRNEINNKTFFVEVLIRNFWMLIFMWIVGLSILGVPILIFYVLYDGFSLGITISYILNTYGFYEGYTFLFSKMYLVALLNTLAMILLCNSAIRVTLNILKQKTNIKTEFIRHSIGCIIILVSLVISSVLEVCINLK